MVKQKQRVTDNNLLSTSSIAIVGASYAGLTLANYIRLHSPKTKLRIFESKSTFSSSFIQGFFEVPNYRTVLKEIELSFNGSTRREIIHTLLNDRVKLLIEFNQQVLQIQQVNPSRALYVLSREGRSNAIQRYGPFHLVIGADGVLSTCRKSPYHGVLVIGDARWAQTRWYDLGFLRINAGGDIAMTDACELGRLLCYSSEINAGLLEINSRNCNKFRVVHLQQRARSFKIAFLCWILFSYFLLQNWLLHSKW